MKSVLYKRQVAWITNNKSFFYWEQINCHANYCTLGKNVCESAENAEICFFPTLPEDSPKFCSTFFFANNA